MKKSTLFQDKARLQQYLNDIVVAMWDTYAETWPALVKFEPPALEVSNRLTRTAGRCFQELNLIEIGRKFFDKPDNREYMINVILVHELAHAIDYLINGESELPCGHGANWCNIMVELGLPANKYHSLTV